MTSRCFLPALALLLAASPVIAQQDGQLKATLARLDEASTRFRSAEAKVHKSFYNSIVKAETDAQDGSIYFVREKSGTTEMGLVTTGKDARTVDYKDGRVRVYNPGIKCFDQVTKPGIDTYLTLGFGGSGKDLEKVWEVTDLGSENMDGTRVEKLDLIPREAAVKSNVTKFTIWVDLATGVSHKQVLLSPSKDLQTATYSDIRLNQKIDTKPFEIKGKPCGK